MGSIGQLEKETSLAFPESTMGSFTLLVLSAQLERELKEEKKGKVHQSWDSIWSRPISEAVGVLVAQGPPCPPQHVGEERSPPTPM